MDKFTQIWTQSNCLSKNQLLQYIQQKLDRDEVYLVESHLNDCTLCSDAIDGLMEEDILQSEQTIAEIKTDINEQIKMRYPTAANNAGLSYTKNVNQTSLHNNEKKSNDKYRWLVAASILLVVGLGGYSVYSFINGHNAEIAQQKDGTTTTDAEYNKPEDANANEITTLRVETPNGEVASDVNEEILKDKKIQGVVKNITPVETKKESAAPIIESVKDNVPESKFAPPTAKEAENILSNERAKKVQDEELKPSADMVNYAETKVAEQPVKAIVSKKKSNVGLSNSKPDYKQNAGEKSYPASQNNQNNTRESSNESISSTAASNLISDYDQAMQYYNAGEYKKSINYFEDALQEATAANKEDIQYQLAQAYLKVGKERKAQKLLEQLAKGTKYSKEAQSELLRVKSAK